MTSVRRASSMDAKSMATLLNAIIEKGGTTAKTQTLTGDDINEWMSFAPDESAWHVALDDTEQVIGFQWISPHEKLPAEACDVATFVQVGRTGLGIDTVDGPCVYPCAIRKFLRCNSMLAESDVATSSASVLDLVTIDCLVDSTDTGPLSPTVKHAPVCDFPSS